MNCREEVEEMHGARNTGEMDEEKLAGNHVLKYMKNWMMVRTAGRSRSLILPAVGRLAGQLSGGLQRRREKNE